MIAFYSDNPKNFELIETFKKEQKDWLNKVKEFGLKYFGHPISVKRWTRGTGWFIPVIEGKQENSPAGFVWRNLGRGDSWIPAFVTDKRTKIGRAAQAEKDANPAPLCYTERLDGMPGEIYTASHSRVYYPGCLIEDEIGRIWIVYGIDKDDIGDEEIGPQWTEAKISEFYAAKERLAEKEAREASNV